MHFAGGGFQHPVATQHGRPGGVGAGGHIGPGGLRQGADKGLADIACGHVAAVNQPVSLFAQGGLNGLQRAGVGGLGQRRSGQRAAAQAQAARAAVADEVNGIDTGLALQGAGDLLQRGLVGGEPHHLKAGVDAGQQRRGVGDIGVDKDDLAGGVACHGRSQWVMKTMARSGCSACCFGL